jgi:DNA-directed RNA polymerase subunit RPC12/RpoP
VEEEFVLSRGKSVECPECGARTKLYRTPRGLRCGECVKRLDSGGLGFR